MTVMHVWMYDNMETRGWGYMKNVCTLFKEINHIFYLLNCPSKIEREEADNCSIVCESSGWKRTEKKRQFADEIENCDKIIFHGLRKGYEDIYRVLLAKEMEFIWVVWGHEVYNDFQTAQRCNIKHPIRTISWKIYNYYFRKVVKKARVIIGEKQDCHRACELLGCNGKIIYYNFGGYADMIIPEFNLNEKDEKYILVGHNAYPDCRHLACFETIRKVDDGKLIVICPLPTDGTDPKLVQTIREEGERLFGKRFRGIYSRQNYLDYCEMLSKCDIALFNHTRQMAQGNVEKLLYYGKKIFFSLENTNYELYRELGAHVYRIDEICRENFLKPLSEIEKKNNKSIIEEQLSTSTFVEVWSKALGETS